MKLIYLSAIFIICVLADAEQISQEELNEIKSYCANEFDITNEVLQMIINDISQIPANSNTQGYAHCILTQTGIYDPINGINEEQVEEVYGPTTLSNYQLCKRDQGDLTPEAFCFDLSICVLEHMQGN